jgi:hypothetical protein
MSVNVEQQGARGVGHVGGVHAAAGQPPHQPGVDGAERQLAPAGLLACAGHVVEQPLQFGARKVGVDHQPGFGLHQRCQPVGTQAGAGGFGAAVLPDDGVVNRLPRGTVPQHGGFALVGDAQCVDVLRSQPGTGQHLSGSGQLCGPDVVRVVLDPARLREDLPKLALRHGHHVAQAIEHDAARAGGALVQGE